MSRRLGFNFAAGRTVALAIVATICAVTATPALAEPSKEYAVKAAFIYNFAQFTQWPNDAFQSADSPFVIGVMGDDPFDGALEQAVAGKNVSGHPMVVHHLSASDEVQKCQLVFVPASQDARLADVFKAVDGKPVLSIGETDNFPWSGGTIRFFMENNKVRFEINPDSADRAHLHISSKLMKLAKIFTR
jgi:hypothetical protein